MTKLILLSIVLLLISCNESADDNQKNLNSNVEIKHYDKTDNRHLRTTECKSIKLLYTLLFPDEHDQYEGRLHIEYISKNKNRFSATSYDVYPAKINNNTITGQMRNNSVHNFVVDLRKNTLEIRSSDSETWNNLVRVYSGISISKYEI